jgi:hypothetical protein
MSCHPPKELKFDVLERACTIIDEVYPGRTREQAIAEAVSRVTCEYCLTADQVRQVRETLAEHILE